MTRTFFAHASPLANSTRFAAPSFHQPLASFAFAQSPLNSSATHFIGVSRDAQSNGNSGHRLEIVELPSRQHTSFLPLHDGILLSTDSPTLEVRTVNFGATTASETAPTRPSKADDADDEAEEGEAQATEGGTTRLSRGRSLSLNTAVLTTLDRNQTPRPGQGGSVTPRRLSMVRGSFGAGESNEEELTGPSALEAVGKDVSSLFGQRVMGGYGSHVSRESLRLQMNRLTRDDCRLSST